MKTSLRVTNKDWRCGRHRVVQAALCRLAPGQVSRPIKSHLWALFFPSWKRTRRVSPLTLQPMKLPLAAMNLIILDLSI